MSPDFARRIPLWTSPNLGICEVSGSWWPWEICQNRIAEMYVFMVLCARPLFARYAMYEHIVVCDTGTGLSMLNNVQKFKNLLIPVW